MQFTRLGGEGMSRLMQYLAMLLSVISGLMMASCSHISPVGQSKHGRKLVFKPKVTIENSSDREIVVGVDGPESRIIKVPARASRVIYLKSGAYQYAVAAENIEAASGSKTFKPNHQYTWNFGLNQISGVAF
jgi:hypothetical protein